MKLRVRLVRALFLRFILKINKRLPLNIKPVIQFKDQSPVFTQDGVRKVIFSIHYKEVRSRFITPLQSCIKVHIIEQVIVLDIGGKKDLIGKGQIYPGTYQEQLFLSIA